MSRHKTFNTVLLIYHRHSILVGFGGANVGATAQLTAKVCEGVSEISKELADFTARRVQEDIKLPERLVKCRSPQDIQQVYLDYWTTAFAQYQAEFGRLAELNQAIGRVAATTFGQTVDKVSQLRIAPASRCPRVARLRGCTAAHGRGITEALRGALWPSGAGTCPPGAASGGPASARSALARHAPQPS
jgi:hypothetical protein